MTKMYKNIATYKTKKHENTILSGEREAAASARAAIFVQGYGLSGYGPEERSWVARDNILDPLLLEDFHRNHSNRPAPKGRGHPRRRVRASGATPGGGVMSGSHCHNSHLHPRSPDLNHLLINNPHLLQLIRIPFICTLSTLPPRPVYRSHPELNQALYLHLPVFTYLRCSCAPPFLFSTDPVLICFNSSSILLRQNRDPLLQAKPFGYQLSVPYSPLICT